MGAGGIDGVGLGMGEEVVGMEAEGGDDIIATRDKKCSFSQAAFLSSESFSNRVALDSHELKRTSNLTRVAAVLGLRNCFSSQFLMITPCFLVMRSSNQSYCIRMLGVPVMAPTNENSYLGI